MRSRDRPDNGAVTDPPQRTTDRRTVRAKLLPFETSQLTDQVIAPPIGPHGSDGTKPPHRVAVARQSSAAVTFDGDW